MKRWINIMAAVVFGAIVLYMTPGFGEAAPAPKSAVRQETTIEHKRSHHDRHSPVRHVRHREDHHHRNHHHHDRHDRYDHHNQHNPHVREIHHDPHHNTRHDKRHHNVRHAKSGGDIKLIVAMDI